MTKLAKCSVFFFNFSPSIQCNLALEIKYKSVLISFSERWLLCSIDRLDLCNRELVKYISQAYWQWRPVQLGWYDVWRGEGFCCTTTQKQLEVYIPRQVRTLIYGGGPTCALVSLLRWHGCPEHHLRMTITRSSWRMGDGNQWDHFPATSPVLTIHVQPSVFSEWTGFGIE